ncbi:MAG TPA: TetR/AcrR family transcriptional regulator [Microbacteriaceae bacterium]|nr:TetR/AcrR family transcriptional regulator [Microbacteriaceae bacterium]
MPRTSYHHGDLRTAAIREGFAVAETAGLEAIVAREIARSVGVSPAAVFRHFPDLEHLKAEVSRSAREKLARLMLRDLEAFGNGPLTAELARQRFERIGRRYVEFAVSSPHLFNAAFSNCGASPAREDDPSPWNILLETIHDLVATGVIAKADAELAPVAAWTAVHGMATLYTQGLKRVSGFDDDPADTVIKLIRRMLYTDS